MEEPVNKYLNGKIYKIVDLGYNDCYYGSTIQPLYSRMARHRKTYKYYKSGKSNYMSSYDMFDNYGLENCKIELVELYPCGSRNELEAREGYYIKNNECLNKIVAGRTMKEYYEDNKQRLLNKSKKYKETNKDHLSKKHKEWYETNKDHVLKQQKEYNENNKDRRREYIKQYRQNNKDHIKEYQKQYRLKKKAEKTDI
jgi:hypothetical protein